MHYKHHLKTVRTSCKPVKQHLNPRVIWIHQTQFKYITKHHPSQNIVEIHHTSSRSIKQSLNPSNIIQIDQTSPKSIKSTKHHPNPSSNIWNHQTSSKSIKHNKSIKGSNIIQIHQNHASLPNSKQIHQASIKSSGTKSIKPHPSPSNII